MIQSKDPTAPDLAQLLASLQGLDLTSADGRCGIKSLLAEIERLSPGAILQQAAGIQLRRLGCVTSPTTGIGRLLFRIDDGYRADPLIRAAAVPNPTSDLL